MKEETNPDCCSAPPPQDSNGGSCPSCGERGKPVKPITLRSLVAKPALERLAVLEGFRFCASPGCDIAYFQPDTAERILTSEVTVAIGQKSTDPERLVCYCFEHTAAEVEAQVAATGTSTLPEEIGAKCKRGLDRCPETNPQGSCCLGNVRAAVKEAQAKREAGTLAVEAAPPPPRNIGLWAGAGALLSAILSSACCWLPLLLIAFGASAAGVAGFFEAYRPYLLGSTAILLAIGFYLVYVREARCVPGSACATPNPKLRRFNKAMLWCATAFTLAFAFFPNYVAAFLPKTDELPPETAAAATGGEALYRIEGMTCEGCASVLHADLSALPGVAGVEVSYDRKTAHLFFTDPDSRPSGEEIEAVIEEDGYKGTPAAP